MKPVELRLALPVIELGKVHLRPWRANDAPSLVAAWADAVATGEAQPPQDRSLPGAERWIAGAEQRCRVGLAVDLVVAAADDDRVLGEVGLSSIDPRRAVALIGWRVAVGERRQGVASLAAEGFVDWALTATGLVAVVAEISAENAASWRIAERCGFELLRPATSSQLGALVRRNG